jgi:hypothetical protein
MSLVTSTTMLRVGSVTQKSGFSRPVTLQSMTHHGTAQHSMAQDVERNKVRHSAGQDLPVATLGGGSLPTAHDMIDDHTMAFQVGREDSIHVPGLQIARFANQLASETHSSI